MHVVKQFAVRGTEVNSANQLEWNNETKNESVTFTTDVHATMNPNTVTLAHIPMYCRHTGLKYVSCSPDMIYSLY